MATVEQQREYRRRYAENNPEKVREQRKRYRDSNRERLRENQRAYHARNPDKRRAYKIRTKYGLSMEEYDALLVAGCVICESMDGLVVDHCHVSGKVRGALCAYCNRGLGQFKDDPALLERAIAYLLSNSG